MADLAAELTQLIDLRDKGLLSPAEFEARRTLLLASGNAAATPPRASGGFTFLKGVIIYICIMILGAAGFLIYVTQFKPAPGTSGTNTMTSNAFGNAGVSTRDGRGMAPPIAPAGGPPTVAAGNPLFGTWIASGPQCDGARMEFYPDEMRIYPPTSRAGVPARTIKVIYTVISPTDVRVGAPGEPQSEIRPTQGSYVIGACTFTKR